MAIDIGLKSEDYIIKPFRIIRKKDRARYNKLTKDFDINAIETNKINIVEIDNNSAKISIGKRDFVVPKSKLSTFKNIVGKKSGFVNKKLRFKYKPNPDKKAQTITEVWETSNAPTKEDAVLVGEKMALFLSGKSSVIDVRGGVEDDKESKIKKSDREPFRFVKNRVRIPKHIAITRGYNFSNTEDYRLRGEKKIVGEVMYKCSSFYDKDSRNNVDICFGIKIREHGDVFEAQKIARFIERYSESAMEVAVRKEQLVGSVKNLKVNDIVLDREFITSSDTNYEAIRIFENLGFEEINDEFHMFDYSWEMGHTKDLLAETPIDSRGRTFKDEIAEFNEFINSSISGRSNLDKRKIKSEFDKRLKSNVRRHGAYSKTVVKTIMELYNDETVFDRNKSANNPGFYRVFDWFIRNKLVDSFNYKTDIDEY